MNVVAFTQTGILYEENVGHYVYCAGWFNLASDRVLWRVLVETPLKSSVSRDGFGGLVVSMLASGTQVRGLKPGRSRWIFTGVKILSRPSSGGEVKESVPCPSFAACKRT